jgi:hypothetical protein
MANEQNLKPFKKGHDERRNTTGKNKKSLDIKEILNNILSQEKNGVTLFEAILIKAANEAIKGDAKARQYITEYMFGKATQKTEIVGEITTQNKEIDLKKLSLDELKELERIANRLNEDPSSDSK